MKARTKLTYNCEKREEFIYGKGWKLCYDRSYNMFVTASSQEECEMIMDSFQEAICDEGIQRSFDSNLTPEYDNKKKAWVGAVEVYVGNECVADEKEAIKEVYDTWKKLLNKKDIEPEEVLETEPVKKNLSITDSFTKEDVITLANKVRAGNLVGGYLPSFGDFYNRTDLGSSHIKAWLEKRGFKVIKTTDSGSYSSAITECGILVSSNGWCNVIDEHITDYKPTVGKDYTNKNNKKYTVLEQKDSYTLYRAVDKNVTGMTEYVVAWTTRQLEVTERIYWLKGEYFIDLQNAKEYFNKKIGVV